ncbi:zinc finger protein 391-like [Colias croceus]|uniref:zinc finger protein 391-like n=1 Tax=Colias crocea TaxID=72248 RepID=UPI001E27A30B|nr:zinc finger protein 391-like [Colias croceus]XP_045503659.1 zinc finger protein 391-like [Colias croceus]
MEFSTLIVPLTNNMCRTCLVEFDSNDAAMFMNIQDLIEHEINKIKLIDILVFLNCLEHNDEENWPQGMCASCVSTALMAYSFKLNCLKANATLSQILTLQQQTSQQSDIDNIDINVVYQDHEYEVPLFSSQSVLDFESNLPSNKELTPLPPVTEITSTEHPPRKEGEKKYSCSLCSKSFTRIYSLRYHMATHSDFRKHLCPKCGKAFFTYNGLSQHLRSHRETAQFKCGFCNKTYKSRQSLKEHFRVAHSSNRKLFVCVTCGKRFTAKSTLVMHTKTHTGQKEFACSLCPKTYTRASYLRAHAHIHSGSERPRKFQCPYSNCNRSFATKHSLLVHIAHTHRTERPHQCDICMKGFATMSGLKIHKISHTANKEVTCETCNKKLSNKRVLQKHMKVHGVNE